MEYVRWLLICADAPFPVLPRSSCPGKSCEAIQKSNSRSILAAIIAPRYVLRANNIILAISFGNL
jgi:hypothetical protein